MTQILILQEGHWQFKRRIPDSDPWATEEVSLPVFIVDWNSNSSRQNDYAEATIILKTPYQFAHDKYVTPDGTIMKIYLWAGNSHLTVDVDKINVP